MDPETIPERLNDLPNICGWEEAIARVTSQTEPVYRVEKARDFGRIRSTFAVALHMHQPLIPAGGDDLRTARVISNLRYN